MRLRHVDGGALVADVDDADAFRIEPHPDRHDVPATQREHALDATTLQETRDQVGGTIRRDFHGATPLSVRGLNQIGASQATSSETVKTAKTCEARIEPEVTPASRP